MLAIQRQPIDVLRRDDEREQPGACEALRQRLRRQRGGAKTPLAARAAVVAADVARHPRLRRHDVELFADHLAQARELDPVMRTGALASRRRVLDVDPLERVGQQGACRPRAPMGRDLGAGVGLGLLARLGLGLVEPPELPVRQLLRRGPKAPRQQQPHLFVQPLDGRLVLFDRCLAPFEQRVALDNLRFELTHPRSQRGELFERCGAGRGGHGRESKAFPTAP